MIGKIKTFLRFVLRYLMFFLVVVVASYGIFYPAFWANIASYFIGSKISISSIVGSLMVFLAIVYLIKAIKHILSTTLKRFAVDNGIKDSFISLIGYIGYALSVFVAFSIAGIQMKNITIVLGALSVGIGFGLQNIVNNFVSGIVILFERPMRVGDWVVVKNNEGIVKRINLRSTEVETFDRASVIIPNSEILSNDFVNWTHTNMLARIDVPVGVGYNTDVLVLRQILLDCAKEHPLILKTPEPYVLFLAFGDNSINFTLRCIVKDVHQKLMIRSDIMFDIFKRLKQANIEIPFPQRVVHFADKKDTNFEERLKCIEQILGESQSK